MNYFKIITVLTINALLLFSFPFSSHAEGYETWVMDNWSKDKEEAFRMAKEQDKFILLFVGRPTCPTCQLMSELLCNPENPFIEIFEDNFVTLYKWYDDEDDRADVYEYIQEYHEEREAGLVRQIHWLYIINPDREGESVISMYRPYPEWIPDEETMRQFLAIDLLDAQTLNWYADEDKVFEIAKEQKKYIFKFVGSGTSPNSQHVMKLLQEEPLKQIMEENYILWYVDDNADDCSCDPFSLFSGEVLKNEEENNTLPYISIINPDNPYYLLEELWGVQDENSLEELLLKYTVSNGNMLPDNNNVSISDNILRISNQTNTERIQVFTITGQRIASVSKNDYSVTIDASYFPKGILIVHSSTGWSAKILKQ